jgi:hypothetical protein
MTPKCKSNDAGNLDMLKGRHKVLPLITKKKVLNKKREKSYVGKIYGKNEYSTHEIVKKEKEIHASFSITSQVANVTVVFSA